MQQAELPMKDVTPKTVVQKLRVKTEPKKPTAKKKKASTAVAVAQPQAPREIKNVLQVIAELGANPQTNPENMRALLDMQKEIMAEQSRRDFDAAFIALQADLANVTIRQDGKIEIKAKDAKGDRTGPVIQSTPYSTFPNIMKAIQPFLTKHGFGLSFATEPAALPDRIMVRGFLTGHGHQRTTVFPLPLDIGGSKSNVQAWGSSQSYGKRYCTIALLNIVSFATVDADVDGHEGNFKRSKNGFAEVPEERPKVSEEQAITLRDLIEWCGVSEAKFCATYTIKKVSELPADLFGKAEKDCKDYHENQKAKGAAR